jgi:hypothetical protein
MFPVGDIKKDLIFVEINYDFYNLVYIFKKICYTVTDYVKAYRYMEIPFDWCFHRIMVRDISGEMKWRKFMI